ERPDPRDADELHDALSTAGFLAPGELDDVAPELFAALIATRRAGPASVPGTPAERGRIVIAVERLPEWRAIHPDLEIDAALRPPASRLEREWTREDALAEILRGRLALIGPTTAGALASAVSVAV